MISKDLGLAAPGRLMVWVGTKGKEVKQRGKPELGDLVNESVPPAVAMGGACVLGLPPQPLARFLSQCTEKVDSQCPSSDQASVTNSTKQRRTSLVSLFRPFLLSSCITLFFFHFSVISQFL